MDDKEINKDSESNKNKEESIIDDEMPNREEEEIEEEQKFIPIKNKAGFKDFWRNINQTERKLLIYCFVAPMGELTLSFMLFFFIISGFVGFLQNQANIITDPMYGLILRQLYDAMKGIYPYILCSMVFMLFVMMYFRNYTISFLGEKIGYVLRKKYFKSLICKHIGWFELNETGNLSSKFTNEINTVEKAIGKSFFHSIKTIYAVVFCIVVSFSFNKITSALMIGSCIFILVICKIIDSFKANPESISFSIAKEIITNIKIILTFDGINKERLRYKQSINEERRKENINFFIDGISSGILMVFLTFCFSIYLFVIFTYDLIVPSMGFMDLFSKIFAFILPLVGFLILKSGLGDLTVVEASRIAGKSIFNAIGIKSEIDPLQDGLLKKNNKGSIEIKNVYFKYPTRDEVILKNISVSIPAGSTVAFVGPSGSGKSTIIKLIQRFYDPTEGSIKVEGLPLDKLNLAYYRKQIGYVGQEPVLFNGTIYENIAQGINEKGNLCLSDVIEACKLSNAHDFINDLPKKYNTVVGEGGCLLSIGQKQRICIARAIINDPPLLLLDEATSALDTTSERVVQDALNKSSVNKTTVVIAHRLSTIRHADLIVAMKDGQIVETGNHEELMKTNGLYHDLVKAQEIKAHNDYEKPKDNVLARNNKNFDLDKEEAKELTLSDKTNILQYMLKYKILFFLSSVLCVVNGAVLPVFAYKLSQIFSIFCNMFLYKELSITMNVYITGIEIINVGLVAFIGQIGKIVLFKVLQNNVKRDLQFDKLSKIVNYNLEFFDLDENSAGILCTKLQLDTKNSSSLYTSPLIFILNLIGGLVATLYLSFDLSKSLSSLMVSILLFIIAFRVIINFGLSKRYADTKILYEKITQLASEAFGNIQTVTSFALENVFIDSFKRLNIKSHQAIELYNQKNNIVISLLEIVPFIYLGIGLAVGVMLLDTDYIIERLPIIVFCITAYALDTLGNLDYIWTYNSSLASSNSYFEKVVTRSTNMGKEYKVVDGKIDTKDIHFSYSTRKDKPILKGLNLSLDAYKNIGVVGPSGCGKSTLMSLLLAFYEADSGEVLFDDLEIKDWSVSKLRKQMALVEQEPKLFNTSIIENIKYGKADATMDEVMNAAKIANAHNFITELSEGYNTKVGDKGGSLSGGQKQRIAIARAIIRNPSILILDEATSALDSFSEQLVQQAIENASTGRTCLSIAHRLASIQNCDLIIVINEGRLFEFGNHNELMEKQGLYYKLANQQNLE